MMKSRILSRERRIICTLQAGAMVVQAGAQKLYPPTFQVTNEERDMQFNKLNVEPGFAA
jgi:hypothetical protein